MEYDTEISAGISEVCDYRYAGLIEVNPATENESYEEGETSFKFATLVTMQDMSAKHSLVRTVARKAFKLHSSH